jgi:hypothetical protein
MDQFGHSATNAALFADYEFDGVIMGRLKNNAEAHRRKSNKDMGFVWKP